MDRNYQRDRKKIIEAESINIKYINFQGIRNKGFITILISPFLLLRACYQVYKIYKFYKPDLTICFGGYVTVPCGLISFLKKIPLFIHEQNSVLGLSNKILSLFSQKILMGYRKPGSKYLYSGNPMRESINRISKKEKNFKNNLNILVLGGSLGAKVFNERKKFFLFKFHSGDQKSGYRAAGKYRRRWAISSVFFRWTA